MTRIAIVGNGRMGQAVRRVAEGRGHRIHTVVTGDEIRAGRGLTAERLEGADIAVEFTGPQVAAAILEQLIQLDLPVVTGTTGWQDALPRITEQVLERGGALLHAANFSLGFHLTLRAARELARGLRGRPELDANLVERHHGEKRDAPSGTALTLQRALRAIDPDRDYPIVSIRAGWTPGTHLLEIDGRQESVCLSHVVRDRATFAEGAVSAAEWLISRRGVFTFDDLLEGGKAS